MHRQVMAAPPRHTFDSPPGIHYRQRQDGSQGEAQEGEGRVGQEGADETGCAQDKEHAQDEESRRQAHQDESRRQAQEYPQDREGAPQGEGRSQADHGQVGGEGCAGVCCESTA